MRQTSFDNFLFLTIVRDKLSSIFSPMHNARHQLTKLCYLQRFSMIFNVYDNICLQSVLEKPQNNASHF